MVALSRPDLISKLPVRGAVLAAAIAGVGVVALPAASLEAVVQSTGIAALLPVAAPPLGVTARGLLALGVGMLVAAVAWSALFLLFGEGGVFAATAPAADGVPAVRRADAHPDAPPRRPLSAAELEEPLDRTLPADLDTPMAALDPEAIPDLPREPVRAVAPLAPGERLQTFALTPPPPEQRPSAEAPSIDALLRRLEQGARRSLA